MGADVLTQLEAWQAFDALLADPRNQMLEEPPGFDVPFRQHTRNREAATRQWANGYLAAFAEAAGLTLVTFDKALAGNSTGAVLLE